MKNFYYVAEVNLNSSAAPDVKGSNEDVRAVSFISRSFMDTASAINSIERDIVDRLQKFIKSGNIPVRISEMNPLRLTTLEKLEEKAKGDEEFAQYLSTWDNDLVTRMSVVDEGLESAEDQMSEVAYEDMPPKDYILRYYIREYDDGMEVPTESVNLMQLTETVH